MLLLIGAAAPAWMAVSQETGPVEVAGSAVLGYADRLLEEPSGERGSLQVESTLISGSEAEDAGGRMEVTIDVAVALGADWAAGRQLRVTIVSYNLDEDPLILEESVALGPPSNAAWWIYRRSVLLPEEFLEAIAVVEDLASGRKGGARVGYGQPLGTPDPAPRRSGVIVDALERSVRPVAEPERPSVIRLVPPRGNEQVGEVRIRTLLTSDEVAQVKFQVDGGAVTVDEREPFVLETDFGPEPATREVVAVALSAAGRELGRDRLLLNSRLELFDLRMALSSDAATPDVLAVEAAVTVPRGRRLDRVEFYRNEELLATLEEGPFVTRVAQGDLGPRDYLRAVAYLTDGSSLDDVRLLSDADAGERIDVNLVQVFAVASNRKGEPLTDLSVEDFEVRVGRRKVEIERFERAVDVPLSLGLVFDTSGSMYPLMPDAKQAGARFLSSILRENDRAFLIDFDTRPRLAHAMTSDVGSLLRRFGQLEAKGRTALYDAVVFGTLQFDSAPGRRALVVLTDGVPSGGEFGARQCIEMAVKGAVPIYSIDLSGVFGAVAGAAKLPLVGLAKATGGRVHTIVGDPTAMDDYDAVGRALTAAYDQIDQELRSQYIMAFSTPQPLTADEIKSVKVEVSRSGVKVRRVVGTTTG
jgi:Ca-activated chloride channel family protein